MCAINHHIFFTIHQRCIERVELVYILHALAHLYRLQKMHFAYFTPTLSSTNNSFPHWVPFERSLCDNRGRSGLIGSASRSRDLAKARPILFSQCRWALKAAARDMSWDGSQSECLCTGHIITLSYYRFQNNTKLKINNFVKSLLMKGQAIIEEFERFIHI